MLSFWIGAAALAGAAAALMSWAAAREAGRTESSRGASANLYARQLSEVDELGARGLLGPEELKAARAEAGRRLLTEAGRPETAWRVGGRSRWAVLSAGGAAALAAVLVYLLIGNPGAGDQPFRARLQRWRAADPARLAPDQLVAVLTAATRERPGDPIGQELLGRAHLGAGDAVSAVQALTRATRLSPRSAPLLAELGEAETLAADGRVTPEAEAAFGRALTLDPNSVAARYFLGRERLAKGDRDGALAFWTPLQKSLSPADPRRRALDREIADAEGAPPPTPGPVLDGRTAALARGMVERLATRLQREPNDPDGWARLIRSYGVLGDRAAQQRALTQARSVFAGRADAVAKVEQAAGSQPPPG